METQYNVVPNIISCKDLDYLSDMFEWNYGAYKNTINAANNANNEEIKQILNTASETFNNSMNKILEILNGGNNE